MEENASVESAELKLSGVIHVPKDYAVGQKRPVIVGMHSFGKAVAVYTAGVDARVALHPIP